MSLSPSLLLLLIMPAIDALTAPLPIFFPPFLFPPAAAVATALLLLLLPSQLEDAQTSCNCISLPT
jgi:hypothetical protein